MVASGGSTVFDYLKTTTLRGKVIENKLIPDLPHSGLSYIPQL